MNQKLTPMTKPEQAIGWPYLAIQLFFLPVIMVAVNDLFDLHLSITIMNVILFVVEFLLVVLIFRRFLLEQLRRAAKSFPKILGTAIIGFFLYMLLAIFANIICLNLQHYHVNANDEAINQMAQEHFWPMAIGAVLLVPVTEETLFRGLLFGTFYRRSPVLGYILSTIVFAAIHVVGYIGTQDALSLLVSFIQYLPAGLALGWAYARSGTLCTNILIHAFVNFIAMSEMR